MKNVLLIILLLLVVCTAKHEAFFGFTGMKTLSGNNMSFKKVNKSPPIGYSRSDSATINPNDVAKLIITVQNATKEITGLCISPIDTVFVHIYTNPLTNNVMYKSRMLFVVTERQYGIQIDSTIVIDANGDANLLEIETDEAASAQDNIKAFDQDNPQRTYFSYENVVTLNNNPKTAMNLVENEMKKAVF